MNSPLLLNTLLLSFLSLAGTGLSEEAPKPNEEETPKVNYVFNATVVRVIDGNTVSLDVDLGFGVWMHNQPFKLVGLDAPDPAGPDKAEALRWKAKVHDALPANAEVVLKSIKVKTDKTKCYHAVLWKDGVNLNAAIGEAIKTNAAPKP